MKRIKIICPKCRGPVWEEEMPDTSKFIDLVCIVCGLRKFYPKVKYKAFMKKLSGKSAIIRPALFL